MLLLLTHVLAAALFGPDLVPGGVLDAVGGLTGLGGAALLAAVAVGAALVLVALRGHPPECTGSAAPAEESWLRRSARRPVPPAAAPDTPGKPRPRAPGAALAAA